MVVAAPPHRPGGGKEIRVSLPKSVLSRLYSPEIQSRIHHFAPTRPSHVQEEKEELAMGDESQ